VHVRNGNGTAIEGETLTILSDEEAQEEWPDRGKSIDVSPVGSHACRAEGCAVRVMSVIYVRCEYRCISNEESSHENKVRR